MIYAGQNNGHPWGLVGENTIVHGANFTANTKCAWWSRRGPPENAPMMMHSYQCKMGSRPLRSANRSLYLGQQFRAETGTLCANMS